MSAHVLATATRVKPGTTTAVNLEPIDRRPIGVARAALLAHEAACQALAMPEVKRPAPVGGPSREALAQVQGNPLRSNGRLKI